MAGFVKNAMSYLGMSDVVDEDDESFDQEDNIAQPEYTAEEDVKPIATTSTSSESSYKLSKPFQNRVTRITTIHPKEYKDAQMVGRALRDGTPVVLNLTGVPQADAYRIIDFSAGVVFGLQGSLECVTKRVYLLSPPSVNIVSKDDELDSELFAD
ncbi:cell division protein SepF [Bifidobacterium dolichotidis]|uniref:Cell division protein SepF n=1 Tax=Bifidobacterium dolichotidis TaxID=2306976 RepID=A0A430FRZ9_9BIFI|nr:cell division protein SepF [Bifidobacterium dolichotidis]RSX55662.1 cell division protein SepF [Bifidobacterium dolichotidis]